MQKILVFCLEIFYPFKEAKKSQRAGKLPALFPCQLTGIFKEDQNDVIC